MTRSHKRGAGGRLNARPSVVGNSPSGSYRILHRTPQMPGDPEHAVCRGEQAGDCVALFFGPTDASDYCKWKNGRSA